MITLRRMISRMLAVAIGMSVSGHAGAIDPPGPILDAGQLAQASGQQIFEHICQACHMPDARGATGAGQFPALAQDPRLASADYMVVTLLLGRRNMPSFRPRPDLHGFEALTHTTLSDAEIARVVNYVRSHFGNHYRDTVSAADVAALHAAHPPAPKDSP